MLDIETRRAIEEAFAGKTCCICHNPAQRLRGGNKRRNSIQDEARYYCINCVPPIGVSLIQEYEKHVYTMCR